MAWPIGWTRLYRHMATDGALDIQMKTIGKENSSLDVQIAALERRIAQQKEC